MPYGLTRYFLGHRSELWQFGIEKGTPIAIFSRWFGCAAYISVFPRWFLINLLVLSTNTVRARSVTVNLVPTSGPVHHHAFAYRYVGKPSAEA